MRRFGGAALVASACVLVACSAMPGAGRDETQKSPATTAPATKPATSGVRPADVKTLDCTGPIDAWAKPDKGYVVILGAVAIYPKQVQMAPSDGPRKYFAKIGLLIKAGTAATLRVEDNALIAWGNHAPEWARELRIPACPPAPGGRGPWLAYPGGYAVDTPSCLGLQIRANGDEYTADIPVGRPC